ncbi:MAG: hypothetical protein ACTHKX_04510, partial [Pseudolysinimonas sp.]
DLPLGSEARDFSLRRGGTPLGFTGAAQVAVPIGVNDPEFVAVLGSSPAGLHYASPGMSPTFQWRRAGVDIAGATSSTYTPVGADAGKALSYRVRVEYPGFMPYTGVSPATAAVATSPFSSITPPSVTQSGLTLHVAPQLSDATPTADSVSIQWYRNGVAVSGKTSGAYTLTSADFGTQVVAKLTYRRLGYAMTVLTAPDGSPDAAHAGKWWVAATPAIPTVSGDLKVGQSLTVDPRTYTRALDDVSLGAAAQVSYQWLRGGSPISGATGQSYTLTASDKGASISVRVTVVNATVPEVLLRNISTSAASRPIGTQSLPGAYPPPAAPSVLLDPSSTDFTQVLAAGPTGITSPSPTVPNVVTYQWYRDATAISGATKSKYTLTQSDRGHEIWVRIITSHAPIGANTYTSVVLASTRHDYTLAAASGAAIHLYTDLSVGAELAPEVPSYEDADGVGVSGWTQKFQWYRTIGTTTTAIRGATASSYYLQAADVGARISVRVTTGKLGYISHIATYRTPVATQKVIRGTLVGTGVAPTVAPSGVGGLLVATPPLVTGQPLFPSSATQHASFTYQWYRSGSKITGATKSTYQLTSSDTNKLIWVVATARLTGYTTVVLPSSTPTNRTLHQYEPAPPRMNAGDAWRIGTAVHVVDLNFIDMGTTHLITPEAISYQWRRTVSGTTTVVATTTTPEYVLQAADLNAKITVLLTAKRSGFIPFVYTTPAISQLVLKGQDDNAWTPVVVNGPGLGQVSAGVGNLGPATPAGTTSGYAWFRNGVAIPGATGKAYTLVAADHDADISVRLTLARKNFEPLAQPTKTSAGSKHTIYTNATTQPVISGPSSPAVGATLTASTPDFFLNAAQTTWLDASGTYTFTWYRSGVAIAGATGSSYTLVAADVGKTITVKVRAAAPGYLAADSDMSAATAAVIPGTIDAGTFGFTTKLNASTHVVTVTRTGAAVTPGTTVTYTWYLYTGLPAVVSTASTYTLPSSAASNGKSYTLLVTLTKPGYDPKPIDPPYGRFVNSFRGSGAPVITGTVAVGNTLTCAAPTFTRADGVTLVPGSNGSIQYTWYSDDVAVGTASTYVVAPADAGNEVRCNVVPVAPYHSRVEWGSTPVYP